MTGVRTLVVEAEEADVRLDRWFRSRFPALSHGALQRLLRTGQIRVDGGRAKAATRLEPGQKIRVPPLPADDEGTAQRPARDAVAVSDQDRAALQGAVLYRDDWVIALDKPAGLAVQGGTGQRKHLDAMLDALRFDATDAPRLVHRLDRDTSGVLLLGRTVAAARALTAAFRSKDARKIYWALVVGEPRPPRGRIALPLGKMAGAKGERMESAAPDAKPALTAYATVATRRLGGRRGPLLSWLVLAPLTGRTHQLRAHCAAMGTPIVGDGKYGGKAAFPAALVETLGRAAASQLMLHAREIAVPHPQDGTTLRVTAPPPPHLTAALAALGFDPADDARAIEGVLTYAEGLAHSPPRAVSGPPPRDQRNRPRARHRRT